MRAPKIEPPANFPADQIAEYRKLVIEAAEEEAEKRGDRLGTVIESWDELKKWWSTKFDPNAKANPDERPSRGREADGPPLSEPAAEPMPAPPAPTRRHRRKRWAAMWTTKRRRSPSRERG